MKTMNKLPALRSASPSHRSTTKKRGQSGKRTDEHVARCANSTLSKGRNFDTIKPDPSEDTDEPLTEAEKVMAHILKIEQCAVNLRKLIREFCIQKMNVTMGYEDSLKGQRACLKKHLNESTYSTICRTLQAVYVEIQLGIPEGKWGLMVLLEFYKYLETDWKVIYASLGAAKWPSLKDFQAKCDMLIADNRIELKNKKDTDISDVSYAKIKACLPNVSDERLSDLLQLVESTLNEKTRPYIESND